MGWLHPFPPPYDALEWVKKPFTERARMACEAWALQGYGSPLGAYVAHLLKVLLYVGGWVLLCTRSPTLGGLSTIGSWWLRPLAFQKAILWSLLFEVLGLGCGSGPLSGRYFPPFGGVLHFLRPGTTKLPFFPGVPLLGGRTRTLLDALLYLALLVACASALVAPEPSYLHFVAIAALVPVLGVLDKTTFLAARGEHYWVTIVCFAFAGNWIAGAKAVQIALWFWAGFSKLNHHFPTVVCVMTSNGPFTRSEWLRRRMYRDHPRDLRPSGFANAMAHAGTLLELGVPIAFLATPLGAQPFVAMALMLALHGYITSNVPMGVPLEWNVAVVYGSFALFWAHPEVSILSVGSPGVTALLVTMLLVIPLAGNLFPRRFSFLLSMRYYAGNWAYSVWLFRGDSHRKLEKLRRCSAWVDEQLARFYDRATAVGILGKVMAFRLMHLHGRALPELVARAVEHVDDYQWIDGELVAGNVLGWNFGEGHLHQEQLMEAVQAQCGFEEGELRGIFVEAQPLGGSTLAWRIVDAKTGLRNSGEVRVSELRARQPSKVGAG